jgi:hypothetical protein
LVTYHLLTVEAGLIVAIPSLSVGIWTFVKKKYLVSVVACVIAGIGLGIVIGVGIRAYFG